MYVVGICPDLQLPPVSGGVIASGVSGVVVGVAGVNIVGPGGGRFSVSGVGGFVGVGCVGEIGTHLIPPWPPTSPPGFPSGVVHEGAPVPPVPAGGVVVPVGGVGVFGLVGVGGVGGLVPAIHARPFGVLVTFPPVFAPGKAQSEPTGPVGAVVAPLLSAIDTQFRLP
jgi:hypothetical protein